MSSSILLTIPVAFRKIAANALPSFPVTRVLGNALKFGYDIEHMMLWRRKLLGRMGIALLTVVCALFVAALPALGQSSPRSTAPQAPSVANPSASPIGEIVLESEIVEGCAFYERAVEEIALGGAIGAGESS